MKLHQTIINLLKYTITKSKTSFCKPDLPAQSSLLKSSHINQNSKSFYLDVGLATVNPSS